MRICRCAPWCFTGAHGVFSSGGNLKTLSTAVGAGLGEPVQSRLAYRNGIQRVPLALCNLEVPTIAAVTGPAIGAGCDLSVCAIYGSRPTRRGLRRVSVARLTPGDGGAWLLPRVVGMSRACEMAFTGRSVDAVQALDMKFGFRKWSAGRRCFCRDALAQEIAQHSGHALRMTN